MNPQNFQDPKMQPPPYTAGNPPHHVIHAQPTGHVYMTHMTPTVVPVVVGQQMSPVPSPMRCQSCNHEIVTRVVTKPTLRTHLFAALLCLIGCWPCVFIPYCTDSCQNADHYCPNCSAYIGTYVN